MTYRGCEFGDFLLDAETRGLAVELRSGTWDLRPLRDDSDFMVAVLART